MGIKISELPSLAAPTNDDIIPVLDNDDNILKAATINDIVASATVIGTEVTQQEYNDLPESEKNANMYFITDGYSGTTGRVISYTDFSHLTPEEQSRGSYFVTGLSPLANAYGIQYQNNTSVGQALDSINSDLTELAKPYITSNSGAIIDNGQIIPTAAGGGVVFQLPFGTSKVHFKLGNSSQVQAGNCLPGSTLPTIITQGTGRSEFNNYSTSGDQSFDFHGAAGWFYIGSGSSGSQNTISNIWCELL